SGGGPSTVPSRRRRASGRASRRALMRRLRTALGRGPGRALGRATVPSSVVDAAGAARSFLTALRPPRPRPPRGRAPPAGGPPPPPPPPPRRPPAVLLADLARAGQADPGAGPAPFHVGAAAERLEHVGQVGGGDPHPLVVHGPGGPGAPGRRLPP